MIKFCYNDGGRKKSGFKGETGDCVVRAISIATGIPYMTVYKDMAIGMKSLTGHRTARSGVNRTVYQPYLEALGWSWFPKMKIGQGCKVHLNSDELPSGKIIVRLSKHLATVIDHTLQDTHDGSRNGTRCVYGFFQKVK